jgi:hypothetical protein
MPISCHEEHFTHNQQAAGKRELACRDRWDSAISTDYQAPPNQNPSPLALIVCAGTLVRVHQRLTEPNALRSLICPEQTFTSMHATDSYRC